MLPIAVLLLLASMAYARPQGDLANIHVTREPAVDSAPGVTIIVKEQTPQVSVNIGAGQGVGQGAGQGVGQAAGQGVGQAVGQGISSDTSAGAGQRGVSSGDAISGAGLSGLSMEPMLTTPLEFSTTESTTEFTTTTESMTTASTVYPSTELILLITRPFTGTVALESFTTVEPDVRSPNRGEWTRGAVYVAGDLVIDNGKTYRVNRDHLADLRPTMSPLLFDVYLPTR